MDRDKRWERVKIAIDGLVDGTGAEVKDHEAMVEEIEKNYKADVTDEFLKPIIVGGSQGRIKGASRHARATRRRTVNQFISDDDTLFFFNYRSDRMREITQVFGLEPKPMEVNIPKNLVRCFSSVLSELH